MYALPVFTLVAAAIELTGDVTCPSLGEVEAKLQPLLPASQPTHQRYYVRLERTSESLRVQMRDATGSNLAERRLAVDAPCADLASAAAVVIATWEVELRGQGTLSLWPTRELERPGQRSPAALVSLGVGAYGAAVTGSNTFAADVELTLGPERGAAEALLDLFTVGEHRVPLGSGSARWWRFGAGAGGRVAAAGHGWQVAVSLKAVLSILAMSGDGFDTDRQDTVVDGGADLGLRVAWKKPRVRPWIGANVFAWPIPRTLKVEGGSAAYDFPRWEALLGAGASFSLSR